MVHIPIGLVELKPASTIAICDFLDNVYIAP